MSPALQSFDSTNVQVIDELQAYLLFGWENHPLTCRSWAGDIHGQRNPLDSPLVGLEDSCSPSSLRSRDLPTHRGQSPHPQHGLSLPVGPTKGSYQLHAWEEGALCNFAHVGVIALGGNTVARLVRVPLAGYP